MRFRLFASRRVVSATVLTAALCATAQWASLCRASQTHYYPFSGDASDAIGTADGTLINEASISGGVLLLDGVDDFVQFGDLIVPTSGSFSVAMFARQTTPQSTYIELISQGSGPGFYLGHDPSGIIRASDSWLSTGVLFPSDGEFHHYALTVDSVAGESKLYVDGSLSATLNAAIIMSAGGTHTRFGRQYDGHAEYFGGALDDVRIYNHTLTRDEVARLAVPEPTTIALSILAVSVAMLSSRRRR